MQRANSRVAFGKRANKAAVRKVMSAAGCWRQIAMLLAVGGQAGPSLAARVSPGHSLQYQRLAGNHSAHRFPRKCRSPFALRTGQSGERGSRSGTSRQIDDRGAACVPGLPRCVQPLHRAHAPASRTPLRS